MTTAIKWHYGFAIFFLLMSAISLATGILHHEERDYIIGVLEFALAYRHYEIAELKKTIDNCEAALRSRG